MFSAKFCVRNIKRLLVQNQRKKFLVSEALNACISVSGSIIKGLLFPFYMQFYLYHYSEAAVQGCS